MNKEEFLRILRERLSILDDREMEDILSEYEQHIDMKTAGAMTEEEAIADFGNVDDLAADILEAYHVRSDYAKEGASSGGRMRERFREGMDQMAAKVKSGACRMESWCRTGWERFRSFWQRLFRRYFGRKEDDAETQAKEKDFGRLSPKSPRKEREEQKMAQYTQGREPAGPAETGGIWSGMWSGTKNGIRSFFDGCKRLILFCIKAGIWCVKWTWNIGWIAAGGMMGVAAAFCLFFLGALLVLGAQGYPVTGVTIGMAGICLVAVSLTGLPFTFLIGQEKKKRKKKQKTADVSAPEEEENHA